MINADTGSTMILLAMVMHELLGLETWAREEGHSLYDSDLSGYTPETMQAAVAR